MPPRHAARRRTGTARRRLAWAQVSGQINFTANNTWSSQDLLSPYRALPGVTTQGITVMATHLWILPLNAAAGDLFWLGLDVRDTNDATGAPGSVATIANPRDNPFKDWMWNRRYIVDNALFLPQLETGTTAVINTRSKRKIRNVGDTYALTVVQETVTTPVKQWDFWARILLALP